MPPKKNKKLTKMSVEKSVEKSVSKRKPADTRPIPQVTAIEYKHTTVVMAALKYNNKDYAFSMDIDSNDLRNIKRMAERMVKTVEKWSGAECGKYKIKRTVVDKYDSEYVPFKEEKKAIKETDNDEDE